MIHQKRTCTYAGISDFSASAGQRRYRPDPKIKPDDKSSASHDDAAALTIYNQSFAVVRQTLPLELKSGTNQLKSPTSRRTWSRIRSSCATSRAAAICASWSRTTAVTWLRKAGCWLCMKARRLSFWCPIKTATAGWCREKSSAADTRRITRPTAHTISSITRQQQAYVAAGNGEPIIEIDGKLQFGLPGQPIFPALSSDTILKPTLSWLLQSDRPGNTNAEFSYVTGGMSWHADYNVVAPVSGNLLDIVGWVTLDNQTGKTFSNAHIKLMAGDVNKLQPGIAGGSFRIIRLGSESRCFRACRH